MKVEEMAEDQSAAMAAEPVSLRPPAALFKPIYYPPLHIFVSTQLKLHWTTHRKLTLRKRECYLSVHAKKLYPVSDMMSGVY